MPFKRGPGFSLVFEDAPYKADCGDIENLIHYTRMSLSLRSAKDNSIVENLEM